MPTNDPLILLVIAYFVIVLVIILREPRTKRTSLVPGDVVCMNDRGEYVPYTGGREVPVGIVFDKPESLVPGGLIRIKI
jgi:hypothetical protein